jgi:hypothetical protein
MLTIEAITILYITVCLSKVKAFIIVIPSVTQFYCLDARVIVHIFIALGHLVDYLLIIMHLIFLGIKLFHLI